MGMLESRLTRFVESHVRLRGTEYFRDGRVTITRSARGSIAARVKGGRLYEVTLTRVGSRLVTQCDCPYYERELDVCKHIWATVLAADRRGLMTDVLPTTIDVADGMLDDMEPPFDDELGDSDEDAIEDEEGDDASDYYERQSGALVHFDPGRASDSRFSAPGLDWKVALEATRAYELPARGVDEYFHPEGEFRYILTNGFGQFGAAAAVVVEFTRPKKSGGRTAPRIPANLLPLHAQRLPNEIDREIFALCAGGMYHVGGRFTITEAAIPYLFPALCRSGRFFARPPRGQDVGPLAFDDGAPWVFRARVKRETEGLSIEGRLLRDDEEVGAHEPEAMFASGVFVHAARIFRFTALENLHWLRVLRSGVLRVPARDEDTFVARLMTWTNVPPIELPEDLAWSVRDVAPLPRLALTAIAPYSRWQRTRQVDLAFEYDGRIVGSRDPSGAIVIGPREAIRRDAEVERVAEELLRSLGARPGYGGAGSMDVDEARVPALVRRALSEGWRVEIDGRRHRNASAHEIRITTGIDWFDVEGGAIYEGVKVSIPALLAAAKSGANAIVLSDGSLGTIPDDLLELAHQLTAFGDASGDRLRFRRSQAPLLDALLAARGDVTVDASFSKLRERLRDFSGIAPVEVPAGFKGSLRAYQKEALGWFRFLQEMGFGGCLADDMGLGKTVQVLALLESRRASKGRGRKPSLVVVPRSLVFNWMAEAAKFTPKLKVLDHSGQERLKGGVGHIEGHDVVLTTYGTLRSDAAHLSKVEWDYAILDESQNVKNASTQSSKAVRLIRADHRLALSGTPIENHLGELWSLFEFLNPGMLGASKAFRSLLAPSRDDGPEKREAVARLVRPFILRRTKGQVAKELPRRTEQTILCELEPQQRKLYDELRDHYRASLASRIGTQGLSKSKIHVLEALLRLRQAACHPGLVSAEHAAAGSTKLNELLARLGELVEEGHKILVFSQFTSFLALVRTALDERRLDYCYLDGATRDRAGVVERFRTGEEAHIFLISLKAGGLGLNLTEADYVILLDPWWNPAVEAQAIDRAHRIGQTRHVIAYRLVARDTVEEKILELQKSKRELADAILGEDKSLIGGLQKEDIEFLLS